MTDKLNLLVIDGKNTPLVNLALPKDSLTSKTNLDLMKMVLKQSKTLKKQGFSDVNRMRLNVIHGSTARALADKKQSLSKFLTEAGAVPKDLVLLMMKDLGMQMSYRGVYIIEYSGPLIILALLHWFRKQIYGFTEKYDLNQRMALIMVLGHYVKRILETIFVHRFANDTMPAKNIIRNCIHYWGFMAFTIYCVMQPQQNKKKWGLGGKTAQKVLFYLFWFFQFLNFMTHMTLRNLRKPGQRGRRIPHGWGFGTVSCANYLWELCAWITFQLMTQNYGGAMFLLVSFLQMLDWASQKQERYLKDFGSKYPSNRKAFIPFLY